MKYNNRIDLLKSMENRMNRYTRSYKSDFEYDRKTLQDSENQYIWIVRRSGTWLFDIKSDTASDFFNACITNYGENMKVYFVDAAINTIRSLSIDNTIKMLAS